MKNHLLNDSYFCEGFFILKIFPYFCIMEKVIEKFFAVGEVVKMDHKVAYSMGNMYGKVQLFPKKSKVFFKDEYQYVGVFDSEYQGIVDVSYFFKDFLKYTGIKPIELYRFVVKHYEMKIIT